MPRDMGEDEIIGSSDLASRRTSSRSISRARRSASIRHIALSADAGLGLCDLNRIKVNALKQPTNHQPIPAAVHFWQKFPLIKFSNIKTDITLINLRIIYIGKDYEK
jgi:hypothetical protein